MAVASDLFPGAARDAAPGPADGSELLSQPAQLRTLVGAAVADVQRANAGQQVGDRILDLMRSLERLEGSLGQLLD